MFIFVVIAVVKMRINPKLLCRVLFLLLPLGIGYSQSSTDTISRNSKDIKDVLKKYVLKGDSFDKFGNRKVAFSLMPAPAGSNSSRGLVISFLTTFYLGDDHQKTKMSEIVFTPYTDFGGQYVFPIQSYIYTKNNLYNFTGDYRYMIYPQPTYGLGNHNQESEMSELKYQQWRFYQFATRKIVGDFRLGFGILYDNYKNISEESFIQDETDYVKYMNGDFSDVSSFGIALQALYDSRKNIINPEQGMYIEADYRVNTNGGIDDRGWESLYLDTRKYISFDKIRHEVLGFRGFYWSTFGGNPHYLDLPSIGWDRYGKTGRGFTRNRFRSNALLVVESEYRTDISKDGFYGAVFFASISSVSKLYTYEFTKWHPAVGTGLRIKWNKKNNNNLTMDFGISKNDWSFRLGLAENF